MPPTPLPSRGEVWRGVIAQPHLLDAIAQRLVGRFDPPQGPGLHRFVLDAELCKLLAGLREGAEARTGELLAFGGKAAMIPDASNTSMGVSAIMAGKNRFTKKVILDRFGIAENTLRSWEVKGIISPPQRDWRGWRWYSKQHLAQIEKHIEKLKRKVERSARQPKRGGSA